MLGVFCAWRPGALCAVSIALGAGALYASACRLTDGLTGAADLPDGALPDDASPDDAAAPTCDADLVRSVANCGACGHACDYGPNAFAACIDGGCAFTCAAGTGDCDDAGQNGCETNLGASRQSCGRCGHDCLGGLCAGGICQPVTLATGVNAPVHIAIDTAYVYGINAFGTVTRVAKDAGPNTQLTELAIGADQIQPIPPRIALNGTSVYYTTFGPDGGVANGGAVMTVQIDGGAPRVVTAATQPYAVTASAQRVYWTEGNPNLSAPTGTVKRCAPGACAGSIETLVPTASGRLFGIAVDGTYLYWTNGGTPPTLTDGSVRKCAITSPGSCATSVDQIAAAPAGPSAIKVDATTVYWTTTSGVIASCLIGTCSDMATRLDASQYNLRFLALDGASVFWTSGDGSIKSIPKGTFPTGAAERVLFLDRGASPWDIAVDPSAIYFTDVASASGPALRRLAR